MYTPEPIEPLIVLNGRLANPTVAFLARVMYKG